MGAAVAGDMRQRAFHALDHGDGQHGVQPLGVEVAADSRRQIRHDRAGRSIGAEIAAEGAQVGDDRRQQGSGAGGIDQQRLGGAADAGPPHLGVGDNGARHVGIGLAIDIGVAEPFGVGQHRHTRLALHPLDQGLAAARDDQVDQPGGTQHGRDVGAVGVGGDLHAGFRQSCGAQAGDHGGMDRARTA